MMRVRPAAEPADFDTQVRQPGCRSLLELVGHPSAPRRPGPRRKPVADCIRNIPAQHLPPHWRDCLPALRASYLHTCAYLGMRIHGATGAATVDHFRPKSRYPEEAYEWSNFRLACQSVNANKGESEDVLDPFEVEAGWFVLRVGDFRVEAGPDLEPERRAQVEATIRRLKLNDPTYRRAREEYHNRYLGLAEPVGGRRAPLPLHWLREECPYVAAELQRQGRLRPEGRAGAPSAARERGRAARANEPSPR